MFHMKLKNNISNARISQHLKKLIKKQYFATCGYTQKTKMWIMNVHV